MTAHSDSDAILRHVLENPLDDQARSVYADYLLGQNDPRGEFINVQLRLANRPNPARRKQLIAEQARLLREHRDALTKAIAGTSMSHKLRRGFIDEIRGSADEFLPIAAAFRSSEPITRLALRGMNSDQLLELVSNGLLGRLSALALVDGSFDAMAVQALADSGQLEGLRHLNLSGSPIGDDGVAALVAASGKTGFSVETLSLNDADLTSGGLTTLAASTASNSITALYVARNEIDDTGLRAILEGPNFTRLNSLGLSGNEAISVGGVLLFDNPELANRFRHVELNQIELDGSSYSRLAKLWGRRMKLDTYY